MKRALLPLGPRPALAATTVAAMGLLSACSAAPEDGSTEEAVTVLASFYPLQYVLSEVGGPDVVVESLTPPGAEPHDVELSPRQVRAVGEADVVVVLGGFQAAVDDAVAAREPAHLLDAATLGPIAEHLTAEDDHEDEEGEAAEEEAAEEEAGDDTADDGHDHAEGDPHFWLDPTLLAAVADEAATVLADADPEGAAGYRERADALVAELTDLDEQYRSGLATCERDVVVTMHEAFGFLAERYQLEQVAVAGLEPDSEPSPARLREVRAVVEDAGVTTIFSESAVDPRVAETLAEDLGLATAVLDPIETQADPGADYRAVMLANLDALRTALGCS